MSRDLSDILIHTPQTVIDLPDPRDHLPNLGKAAARLSIDGLLAMPGLREFSPGPSNQGRRSSCTLHAGVNGTEMIRRRVLGIEPSLSAEAAYNAIRAARGGLGKDDGMTVRVMMDGMRDQGLVPREFWDPSHTHLTPPENYELISIKYPGSYYSMPQVTDQGGRFPEGTNYSLRLWLEWIKLEQLPIWVCTKIPEGDMRSTLVARTGHRSRSRYRSYQDRGYWHEEVVEDIVRLSDGNIYVVVLGSWGNAGHQGRFYIPWENFLDQLYSGQAFAPKREWA